MPLPRPRWRFRLRTLLIAVAVVAVSLGTERTWRYFRDRSLRFLRRASELERDARTLRARAAELPREGTVQAAYISERGGLLICYGDPSDPPGLPHPKLAAEYTRRAALFERLAERYRRCAAHPWLAAPRPDPPASPFVYGVLPASTGIEYGR